MLLCDQTTTRWFLFSGRHGTAPASFSIAKSPVVGFGARWLLGCLSASEAAGFGESPAVGGTTGCEAPTAFATRGYGPWAKAHQNNLFGFRDFRFQATKNVPFPFWDVVVWRVAG